MPEGHLTHRLAAVMQHWFAGQNLTVSSPQGRFRAGAKHLNGRILEEAIANGKHFFLRFGSEYLHVHLGIYGSWCLAGDENYTGPPFIGAPRPTFAAAHPQPESALDLFQAAPGKLNERALSNQPVPPDTAYKPDEPAPNVRLRLLTEHTVADLSGPTACEVLDSEAYGALKSRLGVDPLAPGDGTSAFIAAIHKRSRPIAVLLMEQSVASGIGNVYRAECLFRAGISPMRTIVSEVRLTALWGEITVMLERGYREGNMRTSEGEVIGGVALKHYVYGRAGELCVRCGGTVKMRMLAGRKLYWCPGCQH